MKKLFAVLGGLTLLLTSCGGTSEAKALTGCYEATLASDHYFLNITNVDGSNVEALVAFNNAQKDSSHGTFAAAYNNQILKGIYNFQSEGMASSRELIFKKTARGFHEGFGEVQVNGNLESFKDPTKVTWDTSYEFLPSSNCATMNSPAPTLPTSLTQPTDCTKTAMRAAVNAIVPNSQYIKTQWQPAPGTELADTLNNGGIACSYGLQSAAIGVTARWVKETGDLFAKRIPGWTTDGYSRVDLPGVDENAAYFIAKPQSGTQEFNVWILNISYKGFWISISSSFSHTLEEGKPLVDAALKTLGNQ
jgi:hypothetical protein